MSAAEQLWDAMLAMDGPSIDLEVRRVTIESGRSFSPDAMATLTAEMTTWVGTRVMRRWHATDEPPTVVRVSLTVEVQ